jgi:hypothetical protein
MVGLPFAAPSPAQTVMYADCLIKPAIGPYISSFIDLDTSLAVFIRNGTQGQVFTFDGTSWTPTAAVFALNSDNATSSNWLRLTFRVDFSAKTWDLYFNNVFVATNVAFIDKSATTLPFFIAQGDPTVPGYLNYLAAGWVNPLFANVSNDGISDTWKTLYGLDPTKNDRAVLANNGQTVLYDYINGLDPRDYGGVLPVLTSLVASGGVPGAQGLVQVKVTRASDGSVLANAPITLAVTTGASTISTTTTPGSLTSVNVRTDSTGVASAYVTFSSFATDVLTATAQSGGQAASISINITPPFAKTSISGLRLWLKADTGVTTDANGITTWADQSGNSNNATHNVNTSEPSLITIANDPTVPNHLPVVRFINQGSFGDTAFDLHNVLAGASGGEAFVIFRTLVNQYSGGSFWNAGTGGSTNYNGNNTISDGFFSTASHNEGMPNAALTNFNLYDVSSQANDWEARLNGILLCSTGTNSVGDRGAAADLSLGAGFSGDVAEIIVYNQVLTPAQRDAVNTYLGIKYGLYTVPPAPTSLSATPLSPDQVSVQWLEVPARSDQLTYLIERSTDGVNFTQVAAVRNSLSYIDTTGLVAGTSYTYRVLAQGYAGSSNPSNTAVATIPSTGTDLPLAGMRLWLKADAGTNGPGIMAFWADQSGSGNNATPNGNVSEPSLVTKANDSTVPNGRPVVRFLNQGPFGATGFSLPDVLAGASGGEAFVVLRTNPTQYSGGLIWNAGTGGATNYGPNVISDGFFSTTSHGGGAQRASYWPVSMCIMLVRRPMTGRRGSTEFCCVQPAPTQWETGALPPICRLAMASPVISRRSSFTTRC